MWNIAVGEGNNHQGRKEAKVRYDKKKKKKQKM
jgi:hypothetical protein